MLFSVIVPVYGVEKYLNKCVDSILGQSFDDFELILVDDGSKDRCPEICDEYEKADSRVRVIHKENGKLVSARNTGIRAATGEYICYVDADDRVTDNWLETIAKLIDSSPSRPDIVAFGSVRDFGDHTERLVKTIPDGFYDKKRLENEVYPVLMSDRRYHLGKECIYTSAWNKSYKRELLSKHYCRDEKITRSEDAVFVFECFLYAESLTVSDDLLYYYNKTNSGSNLSRYDENRTDAVKRVVTYLNKNIRGMYDCVDAQMNDLFTNYTATILVHELTHHPQVFKAAKNIRRNFNRTKITRLITPKGLPLSAKMLVMFLKLHCYVLALLGTKLHMKGSRQDDDE
ncbi:MAG: glycosyltransferase family 2 protein [Ruminococcus sp.]|nr:glycosyltransferase family 2 protein [Ruminococcus sp.]